MTLEPLLVWVEGYTSALLASVRGVIGTRCNIWDPVDIFRPRGVTPTPTLFPGVSSLHAPTLPTRVDIFGPARGRSADVCAPRAGS